MEGFAVAAVAAAWLNAWCVVEGEWEIKVGPTVVLPTAVEKEKAEGEENEDSSPFGTSAFSPVMVPAAITVPVATRGIPDEDPPPLLVEVEVEVEVGLETVVGKKSLLSSWR